MYLQYLKEIGKCANKFVSFYFFWRFGVQIGDRSRADIVAHPGSACHHWALCTAHWRRDCTAQCVHCTQNKLNITLPTALLLTVPTAHCMHHLIFKLHTTATLHHCKNGSYTEMHFWRAGHTQLQLLLHYQCTFMYRCTHQPTIVRNRKQVLAVQ